MNILGKSPVAIARETWQTGRLIADRINKTSGEEGDRRIGATVLAGAGVITLAFGTAAVINKVDFNAPKPLEVATLPVEACEAYDSQATEILGRLAMDSRLVVVAGAAVQGGTELTATLSNWGTSGTLTFLNRTSPMDQELISPDLVIRGEAVGRFTQATDTYLTTVSFDGNKALRGATTPAGEPLTGEYYADDAPISLAVVGTYHPDKTVSTECKITSPPKNIHQAGKAETVPVERVVDVALAVTQELAS